jgi:hypothetical protein
MNRYVVLAAIVAATLGHCCGCGRSRKADANVVVTNVSASKPAGPTLVHGKAFLVTDGQEIPFTLVLPPAWTWSGVQADKTVSIPVTSSLLLTTAELPDDEKAESTKAAARRRLEELADGKMLSDLASGEKITIRDRRIIQVADDLAVWDVVTFQPDVEQQPTRLEARCHLKLGDKQFTIEARYVDERNSRTAEDFDAAQAEFLTISQSFRLDRAGPSGR